MYIEWAVSFPPVPAITGTLLSTASTIALIADKCSSSFIVLASPVVPQATMASVPFAIWNSTNSFIFSKLTFPFSSNGVTKATAEPLNIIKKSPLYLKFKPLFN